VRRLRWVILIGELVLLAVVLVVPPLDLPQTAFNEADTPINQATVPVVLSFRSVFTSLCSAATSTSIIVPTGPTRSLIGPSLSSRPAPRSRSLLALLCMFLC
jgi:hypothetical protein